MAQKRANLQICLKVSLSSKMAARRMSLRGGRTAALLLGTNADCGPAINIVGVPHAPSLVPRSYIVECSGVKSWIIYQLYMCGTVPLSGRYGIGHWRGILRSIGTQKGQSLNINKFSHNERYLNRFGLFQIIEKSKRLEIWLIVTGWHQGLLRFYAETNWVPKV